MKQHVTKQFFILSISEIGDGKVGCWQPIWDLKISDLKIVGRAILQGVFIKPPNPIAGISPKPSILNHKPL